MTMGSEGTIDTKFLSLLSFNSETVSSICPQGVCAGASVDIMFFLATKLGSLGDAAVLNICFLAFSNKKGVYSLVYEKRDRKFLPACAATYKKTKNKKDVHVHLHVHVHRLRLHFHFHLHLHQKLQLCRHLRHFLILQHRRRRPSLF